MAGLRWMAFLACLLLVTLARCVHGGSSRLRLQHQTGRPYLYGLGGPLATAQRPTGLRHACHDPTPAAATLAATARLLRSASLPALPHSLPALLPAGLRCSLPTLLRFSHAGPQWMIPQILG